MHSAHPHHEPRPGRGWPPGQPDAAGNQGQDPCLPIQVDLSAMLDGELDPAGVRRVTMHSDACASCKSFFDGIRKQVGLHRRMAASMASPDELARDEVASDSGARGDAADAVAEAEPAVTGHPEQNLRRQLTGNQRKLSRILYELGRNFILMGLSPEFSREVAKEPMPLPDMALRGRHLLDEVSREEGPDWVTTEDLFDGQLRSPAENLARGQRLLTECLALDHGAEDARVYLGLVHYARGQRALARRQFRHILDHSVDAVMRGFALSNLSNIHLDEGDCDGAVTLLLEVVESGAVAKQPRLFAAYFNLALAYGLKGSFSQSLRWFGKLYEGAPHRRRWVAQELQRRSHFLHLVHAHPGAREIADCLPKWFPSGRSGFPAGPKELGGR
jgi:tetratricopeptide (TPR) repeat protein